VGTSGGSISMEFFFVLIAIFAVIAVVMFLRRNKK